MKKQNYQFGTTKIDQKLVYSVIIFVCFIFISKKKSSPIPVVAWAKAWVCGHSLAGIAGSNPAEGMDVCLL